MKKTLFPSIRKPPKITPAPRSWIPGIVVKLEVDEFQEMVSKNHYPFPPMK